MGANAATKAYRVVENVERVLGIELMNAAQAIEFRRPLKTSRKLEKIIEAFRTKVSFVASDEFMSPKMHASTKFIEENKIDQF